MRAHPKKNLPVGEVRRYPNPGPTLLVSSPWKGRANPITWAWPMVMGTDPSLIGSSTWARTHPFELGRRGRECVVNGPTGALAAKVVGIANCSGRRRQNFRDLGAPRGGGPKRGAPARGAPPPSRATPPRPPPPQKQPLFGGGGGGAHVARSPKCPRTLPYRGGGVFMQSGANTARWRSLFGREMLWGHGQRVPYSPPRTVASSSASNAAILAV